MENLVSLTPYAGLFGLLIALVLYLLMVRQPTGTDRMREIADTIHTGRHRGKADSLESVFRHPLPYSKFSAPFHWPQKSKKIWYRSTDSSITLYNLLDFRGVVGDGRRILRNLLSPYDGPHGSICGKCMWSLPDNKSSIVKGCS